MNDIDLIVGVKDLATSVLDRISSKVNSLADTSKLAFSGAAERLNDQLAKGSSLGSGIGGGGNNDKLAKAIEAASNSLSSKLDAALAKTNTAIDGVVGKVQNAISSVTGLAGKAAAVATVGAAFITVGRSVYAMSNSLGLIPNRLNQITSNAEKTGTGVLGVVSQFQKFTIAAGATVALTNATIKATSATTGLLGKVGAVAQGGLAVFVLRNAMKKTEDGASTLTAKVAKIAGTGLAFYTVSKAVTGFGLSLLGLKKQSDDAHASLLKTANASKSFGNISTGFSKATSFAALGAAGLASKIDDLPQGAQTLNSVAAGFGNITASVQKTIVAAGEGIPIVGAFGSAIVGIPAALAGVALAAYVAADKTAWQLTRLTDKLALMEAAKLNISIDKIDTAPLRKAAEETERLTKQIQAATNKRSSDLISLATSSLTKGLGTDQIGEALKAATGLSEVFDTTLPDGMYRARQAIEGNFSAFEKVIPGIAAMTTHEEKLAAVSLLASNGFKVLEKESGNLWGTIEKVKNGLGNVLESMGRMRSSSDVVGTVLRDVLTPAVTFLDSKLKGFGFDGGAVLEQAKLFGSGVAAAIDTIGSNWDLILSRMATASELFWLQLKSNAENFGQNVMPWLANSMTSVFEHAFASIGKKQKTQIEVFGAAVMETFGQAPKGSAQAVAATASVRDSLVLPSMQELKPRKISDQENQLDKLLKKTDATLGEKFQTSFEKVFNSIDMGDKRFQQKTKPSDINLPNIPPAVIATPALDAAKKSANRGLENFTATQSRLLTRGPAQDAAKFTAQNTALLVALVRQQVAQQEREYAEIDRKKGRVTNLVVVK